MSVEYSDALTLKDASGFGGCVLCDKDEWGVGVLLGAVHQLPRSGSVGTLFGFDCDFNIRPGECKDRVDAMIEGLRRPLLYLYAGEPAKGAQDLALKGASYLY